MCSPFFYKKLYVDFKYHTMYNIYVKGWVMFVKKTAALILAVIILIIGKPVTVCATGGVVITVDNIQPALYDTVTVSVTFNTASDMTAFSYILNFDEGVLEFSSTSASQYNLTEDGRLIYVAVTDEVSTITETYTFRCIKGGDTSITVTDIYSADNNEYQYDNVLHTFTVKVPGDVNEDGVLTTVDLGNIKLYLSGVSTDINLLNSDLNNDGEITTLDLAKLKLILAGA